MYLAAEERGRGTGLALYGAPLPLPLLRDLGLTTALVGIPLPDPGSVGLPESLGSTAVGACAGVGFTHGHWHDVGWWQLALVDPPPAPPSEPREWQP